MGRQVNHHVVYQTQRQINLVQRIWSADVSSVSPLSAKNGAAYNEPFSLLKSHTEHILVYPFMEKIAFGFAYSLYLRVKNNDKRQ